MSGPFVVIPAEMFIYGRGPTVKGEPTRPVESRLCIEWDDETAEAGGWRPLAAEADNAVTYEHDDLR